MKMNFNNKCNNCLEGKISIIKIFFIIHGILDNKISCSNCKSSFKIKDSSLKKYKYLVVFLALGYLISFFTILFLQNKILGNSFNFLGIILGLLIIFITEYLISKKMKLEKK